MRPVAGLSHLLQQGQQTEDSSLPLSGRKSHSEMKEMAVFLITYFKFISFVQCKLCIYFLKDRSHLLCRPGLAFEFRDQQP